jgi:hypothetical protein
MALAEGKRGLFSLGKGAQNYVALGDYSEAYVTEALPRYYAANYNGLLFHFSSGQVTAGSTNLSPLPAGTAAPAIALWNPTGSGKNIVVAKVAGGTVSGTPGGPLSWNYATWTTPTTAALSTPVSGIMNGTAASIAKVYSGAVTTGSLIGIFYKHAAWFSAVTALGSASGTPFFEDVGGDVIIPPGTWGALASYSAGTTHVFQCSVTWLELPI